VQSAIRHAQRLTGVGGPKNEIKEDYKKRMKATRDFGKEKAREHFSMSSDRSDYGNDDGPLENPYDNDESLDKEMGAITAFNKNNQGVDTEADGTFGGMFGKW